MKSPIFANIAELRRRIAQNKQTRGETLNLASLALTGLEPELLWLADLRWLEDLDLSKNRITDVSFLKPLMQFKDLGYVHLEDNLIEDLSPLLSYKDASNDNDYPYWSLFLDNNLIYDLSPLSGAQFRTFSAKHNRIEAISLDVPTADDHFRFAGNPAIQRMEQILGRRVELQSSDQLPNDIYPFAEVRECLERLKG